MHQISPLKGIKIHVKTAETPLCDSDIRYQFYNERYIIKEWIQNTEYRIQFSQLQTYSLTHLLT